VGAARDGGREAAQGTDERAREGVEHLQAAAREAIEAARALLDVAERLVEDPAAVQAAVGTFGTLAQAALQRLRPTDPRQGPTGPVSDPDTTSGSSETGRVQRIQVS
jgi:hypothetical protein